MSLSPQDQPAHPRLDGPRLARQLDRVLDLMADGHWRTLREIARAADWQMTDSDRDNYALRELTLTNDGYLIRIVRRSDGALRSKLMRHHVDDECSATCGDHQIDTSNGHEFDEARNEGVAEIRYGDRCRACGLMVWTDWRTAEKEDS